MASSPVYGLISICKHLAEPDTPRARSDIQKQLYNYIIRINSNNIIQPYTQLNGFEIRRSPAAAVRLESEE